MISIPCSYAAGGLECINEPPPPYVVGQSSWVDLSPGFGEALSLATSVDTCNGDARISFAAGGSFPAGKALTFYHNSRDSRRYPAGVGRTHTYNIMLLEHPDEWHLTDVRIVLPTGYRIGFDENLDGSFRGEPGIRSQLIRTDSGGYLLYADGEPNMVAKGNVCYQFGPADELGRCRMLSISYGDRSLKMQYILSGPATGEIESIQDDQSNAAVKFNYDNQGRLQSVVSLDGIKTEFKYNDTDDISQASSSWGTLIFSYDSLHNIQTVTDGLGGHCFNYKYADSARAVEFRDTNSSAWSFSYTTSSTDAVTSVTFGPQGNVPTVYEINSLRLVETASIPGKPKMCYSYTKDKRFLGARELGTTTANTITTTD